MNKKVSLSHQNIRKSLPKKHPQYFCVQYIRFISVSSILALIIVGQVFYPKTLKQTQVLAAETSSSSCRWWDIGCYFHISFFMTPSMHITQNTTTLEGEVTPVSTEQSNPLDDSQSITDSQYNFSMQIPNDWFRAAELPSYFVGDNGKTTAAPTGTPYQKHSFIITAPRNATSMNFEILSNPLQLPLQDFINTFELQKNAILGGNGFTLSSTICTKQFGSNTAEVLEATRTNSTGFSAQYVLGIYFARGPIVFKFGTLPDPSHPSWPAIDTIINSFTAQGILPVPFQKTCTILPKPAQGATYTPDSSPLITGKIVGDDGVTPVSLGITVRTTRNINVPSMQSVSTHSNPWSLPAVAGVYEIDASPDSLDTRDLEYESPNGIYYKVYHSVCMNCTTHDPSSYVPGSLVNVGVDYNNRVDIYYKYVKIVITPYQSR